MRASLRRFSLLSRFSVLSFVVIAGLGVAVGAALHQRIERRALLEAIRVAEVFTTVAVQPHLEPNALEAPLTTERQSRLDADLQRSSFPQLGVSRVKLFSTRSQIVYSDDRALVGEFHPDSKGVLDALAGRTVAHLKRGVEDDGAGSLTLEVYVPVRFRGAESPLGVFEVYLDYDPVAAAIREDSRRLYLLLAGGLLLLYATLWRIVAVASRRLRHQALHDELTDLPNRTLLYERMEHAVAAIGRSGGMAALLLIDLDRFKEVNDTLGHDHGDALLEEVAARLRDAVRQGDTLARLGGDEFAVLLTGVPNRGAVVELAARLQDVINRPFALRGVVVALEASIGIALCPDHGRDVNVLVQRADVAMYDAKRSRTRIETYAAERDPYSPERLRLLGELRGAIDEGQLVLHYQPKVALDRDQVIGVEALVRWDHPRRGLLPPSEFVPLAERTGMISHLTHWVLDTALAQCRAWRDSGVDLPVAVNLAAPNLVDAGLPDMVAGLLERWDVPGERLECEISEHTVMADPERALDVMERLRALGVRLSLDDYGTGRASLAYLKSLPLDEVKIDRSFVSGMASHADDAAIVRSTIELARNLGLGVVAEGVESEAILRDLADLSCDIAQGFFLSRPLPARELDAWMAARAATRSA
jgi:diguanylate cyclase (GGDEF)-like protein